MEKNREEAVRLTREKVTIHEMINFDKKPENPVKVSIVVPVCNVEQYLRECIDSCVNQTLRDIEIICVNDGSTDSCPDILREYAEMDERVKVVNKDNAGYGHTMNLGMDLAQGEYIGIVESDDFVVPEMYEELYNAAKENNVDLIKADFKRFKVINDYYDCEYFNISKDPALYNKVLDLTVNIAAYKLVMNTWSGIYRRKYLQANNIRHNETPGASYQDNGFWFQTFAFAKRGYFVDKPYYMNRRDNPNSSVYSKAKVFCMCDEYKFIREIIDRNYEDQKNLLGVFHLRKFHNYKFNYTRVAPEYKLPFLKVFHDEFREAYDKGELDKSLFTDKEWRDLSEIISDDYIEFNSRFYWEKLMWNRDKVDELEEKIYELTRPAKPDISVIVPVYNVGAYLEKCLNSLVNQTYRNIEIICVDDGSTDSSTLILNGFAERDSRIKVITSENFGVSHARNLGIKAAVGNYIMFVDADDYIDSNTCSILINDLRKSNADIVVFGGSTTTGIQWIDARLTPVKEEYIDNTKGAIFSCGCMKPFIWNKIYRRSLIADNQLYFDESMDLGEDQYWLFKAIPRAEKIKVIKNKFYHYLTGRNDSAMARNSADPAAKAEKHFKLIDGIYEHWSEMGYIGGNERGFAEWLIMFMYNTLLDVSFNEKGIHCREFIEKFNSLIEPYENDGIDEETLKCLKYLKESAGFHSDKPDISVIIPVYNVEEYLAECINSISNQTFLNIEIIAVDDGSTDGSYELLEKLAEHDDRIIIKRQENLYAGIARNNGMRSARGDYLMFLDADDFFGRSMLETLYKTITETDSDICICDGRHYHTDTGKFENVHSLLNSELIPENVPFSGADVSDRLYNITSSIVWNKLFKKEFIEKNALRFSGTRTANDVAFVNQALAFAEKITYTTEKLVNYRVGLKNNLQTVKKDSPLDFYEQFLKVKEGLAEHGMYDMLRRTFSSTVFSNCIYHLNTIDSAEAFITIYNKVVGDGMSDFDFESAKYDSNYFTLDFLNEEFRTLTNEDGLEHIFCGFRKSSIYEKKLIDATRRLEWNRGELRKAQDNIKALKNAKPINNSDLEKCKKDLSKSRADCERALKDAEFYRSELDATRNSISFKLAMFITWLPRKIRAAFKK